MSGHPVLRDLREIDYYSSRLTTGNLKLLDYIAEDVAEARDLLAVAAEYVEAQADKLRTELGAAQAAFLPPPD